MKTPAWVTAGSGEATEGAADLKPIAPHFARSSRAVIPGCAPLGAQTRNPEVAYDLWIPGSRRRGAPRNDEVDARRDICLQARYETGMTDTDVVIIGAGHNGLTCAAYLAMAGMRVRVVE